MSAEIKADDIDKGILTGAGIPPLSTGDDKGKGTKGGTYGGISVIRRGKTACRYKLSGRKYATRRKKYADRRSVLASKRDDMLTCNVGSNVKCTKSVMMKRKENA